MSPEEKAELKTFLTLKYGTLDRMYQCWLLDEMELSNDEKDILVEDRGDDYAAMLFARLKFRRARHGVFQ